MEQKDALLDSLAELRAAHDKASRLMAEIAALGARAMKGGAVSPSLSQLRLYEEAAERAQRQAALCQELLIGAAGPSAEASGGRPYVH